MITVADCENTAPPVKIHRGPGDPACGSFDDATAAVFGDGIRDAVVLRAGQRRTMVAL